LPPFAGKVAKSPTSPHVQASLCFEDENNHPIVAHLKRKRRASRINQIAIALNMPIRELSTQLFELEMNGEIKTMPGGMYQLYKIKKGR
jgi:DNA processing protein